MASPMPDISEYDIQLALLGMSIEAAREHIAGLGPEKVHPEVVDLVEDVMFNFHQLLELRGADG